MKALIGVFIPAYNAAAFLDTAITSVLNQTFQDFELIFLDDASTDDTPLIAEKYKNHPKVTYIRNPINLGMSKNWNKGISLCENKYVAKLDADDYYHPEFLDNAIDMLEENQNVGMVFSGLNWVTHDGTRITEMLPYTTSWIVEGNLFQANLLRKFVVYGPTIVVKKECYEHLGSFLEEMRMHSDWEMWTRVASKYDIGYVNKILASALRHQNNITSKSRMDTHTTDDFTLWLRLLDEEELPYQLDDNERVVLEAAMVRTVRSLLGNALSSGSHKTAEACAQFLVKRQVVPSYEKMRYQATLELLQYKPQYARLSLRGSRWTEKLWPLERWLSIKIPAKDPYDALGLEFETTNSI